jgi:uncharacterized alpha-E superfamily protein
MYSARQLLELAEPLRQSDWPLLDYMLEVADSSITYRSRYYTTLQPIAVLDVLMMDGTNPRSLDFQLSHIADIYGKLPRHVPEDLRTMTNALALLRSFNLQRLHYPLPGANGMEAKSGERDGLTRVLRELNNFLPSWSNNLSNTYFSHTRTLPISIGE